MALSLGSEFLTRAEVEHPGRLRTATLVTPTGFSRRATHRRPPGSGLIDTIEGGAMPHFEQPGPFFEKYERFQDWARALSTAR